MSSSKLLVPSVLFAIFLMLRFSTIPIWLEPVEGLSLAVGLILSVYWLAKRIERSSETTWTILTSAFISSVLIILLLVWSGLPVAEKVGVGPFNISIVWGGKLAGILLALVWSNYELFKVQDFQKQLPPED